MAPVTEQNLEISTITTVPSNETKADFRFTGRYRLINSTNFDSFLSELGLGYFTRKLVCATQSEYIITYDRSHETHSLKTVTLLRESEIRFRDGVEFIENRIDGEKVRTVIKIDKNRWIQKQFVKPEVTIVREFDNNLINNTFTINDVVSIRVYEKVSDIDEESVQLDDEVEDY